MSQKVTDLATLLAFAQGPLKTGMKAFCRLGCLGEAGTQAVQGILRINTLSINLLVDSDGIRHTLARHGLAKSIVETDRGQIPITEADILALATWLPAASVVRAGEYKSGKQPRVELEWPASDGTTIAILEWRPGRQQLALVTMYKKRPAA